MVFESPSPLMSSFHLLVLETAFQEEFRDGLPAESSL